MPYYYGFDYYYIILVLPCIAFAMWAQFRVKSTFEKYSHVYSRRQMTGAQAAAAVLRAGGVNGVRIERVAGHLTDHFDPRDNVIRLSQSVYDSTSVASIGVAAHEAGHAGPICGGLCAHEATRCHYPADQSGLDPGVAAHFDRFSL